MNLSEIFIKRPIATSLLMAGIALFGVVAYRYRNHKAIEGISFNTDFASPLERSPGIAC